MAPSARTLATPDHPQLIQSAFVNSLRPVAGAMAVSVSGHHYVAASMAAITDMVLHNRTFADAPVVAVSTVTRYSCTLFNPFRLTEPGLTRPIRTNLNGVGL
ncbi:hypothetical protein DBA20_15440 [Pandoraea capi]|nr:hypothetical protein [Pandoraea sp. LA3]MDN4584382.1 hypothetical protein [Pandoraea capi]